MQLRTTDVATSHVPRFAMTPMYHASERSARHMLLAGVPTDVATDRRPPRSPRPRSPDRVHSLRRRVQLAPVPAPELASTIGRRPRLPADDTPHGVVSHDEIPLKSARFADRASGVATRGMVARYGRRRCDGTEAPSRRPQHADARREPVSSRMPSAPDLHNTDTNARDAVVPVPRTRHSDECLRTAYRAVLQMS